MKTFFASIALAALICAAPVQAASLSDCSGSIVTGGPNVVAAAAITTGAPANFLLVENPSATASGVAAESLWLNLGAVATTSISAGNGSIEIPNGTIVRIALATDGPLLTNSVNINAATTGHKFVCKRG